MKAFPFVILFVLFTSCSIKLHNSEKSTTIAFGSGAKQYNDAPVFNAIVDSKPDICMVGRYGLCRHRGYVST